jgi:uncharacterized phosphatase
MQTTTIALIRHGETEWNANFRIQGRTDVPLNETGIEQAARVAERLRETEWHRVFASPLSRASDTARIIAEQLALTDFEHREDLIERSFGQAEGLPPGPELDAVRISFGEYQDAETEVEVGSRGVDALEAIHESYTGQNLIVVSHGSYIRCTLDRLLRIQAPRINNVGVTMLQRHSDGWWADVLNDEPVALGVAPSL